MKKFSLIIRVNLNMFFFPKLLTQTNHYFVLEINFINNIKKL